MPGHLEKLPCFMESEKFPFDFIGKIFALLFYPNPMFFEVPAG